jgi:hypothetical protein
MTKFFVFGLFFGAGVVELVRHVRRPADLWEWGGP